ncbi:hypothetical protein Taro_026978 [Colocasia esculenta]|uniref:Uncharacterized protein n=1 Tax=Colocasia esculenta TaxID=4460 RepID=A0A843VGQ2_COLES|nr:hypothetical protein [Colocasia esculenta]
MSYVKDYFAYCNKAVYDYLHREREHNRLGRWFCQTELLLRLPSHARGIGALPISGTHGWQQSN